MQITEFADRAGVSPRALRHYEEQGLLAPDRTSSGYRVYADDDLVTVARIRMMIEAGLGTAIIRRYLDCVRSGVDGLEIEMCPELRRELDGLAARLDDEEAGLHRRRKALERFSSAPRRVDHTPVSVVRS
ncbi:MerR family transcriptional regulator [Gordonia soli]|uniref:Putative MerR family transcriptional regulator n=1 Tax=Gordonia soli NBRC 108243 TaxID=1223545 RepID=M0QK00_9ACTN|nr:MerR family transcriptional regulator [Gordonia soli]GAC68945.1 putative MerR family transcriptional regulator [Gordonia soli NBRC 108243]